MKIYRLFQPTVDRVKLVYNEGNRPIKVEVRTKIEVYSQ
ncbi:hypothetical protein SXCC_00692 [Gluconacetobacter sp. SXCC-1]|nr:hypothetical protein SXCC_00692 [Gluconacetobacter sp. SXCC-1]